MTGLGMTETSPSCTFGTGPIAKAGYVGVPAPGCKVKLVPWRQAGSALPRPARHARLLARARTSPRRPSTPTATTAPATRCASSTRRIRNWGFMFDGRIAEDFKLSTGTFVSVGPLRARVISQGAPYVQDAVVTGLDRHAIGLLVFPRMDTAWRCPACRPGTPAAEVLASAPVRASSSACWATLNATPAARRNGSNACCCWPSRPRSTHREQTDKGSINQAAVLTRRAALVDAMYDGTDSQAIFAA
jgi:feruloyl-CoA synthase